MCYGGLCYLFLFIRLIMLPLDLVSRPYDVPLSAVFMGVGSVNEQSLVETPLWSLDVVCCATRQDTLSTLSQSTRLKLFTGLC